MSKEAKSKSRSGYRYKSRMGIASTQKKGGKRIGFGVRKKQKGEG